MLVVAVAVVFAMTALGCSDDDLPGTGSASTATGSSTSSASGGGDASGTGGEAGAGGAGASGGGGAGGAPMGPSCNPPAGELPPLKLTEIARGIDRPVLVTHAPGDSERLFVAERDGTIRLYKNGAATSASFLDLEGLVSHCCEGDDRSFLGLAFHPDYARNGRFFVHYSALGSPGDNSTVLAEYARSEDDPDMANPVAVKVFLQIDQDYHWHYGGNIHFGPDGLLYVSRGDGGSGGDPENHAQNIGDKRGKMLRIDVDTHPVPPANNLPGADPDVWSYGLRNPWRWSFDRCTGDIYIGDVGQNAVEEVDVEPAGEGHKNYGWDLFEATTCYEGACDTSGLTPPLVEYDHNEGCAVIGGYVYRGHAIPALRGAYLYGDVCRRRIFSLRWEAGALTGQAELSDDLESATVIPDYSLVAFGEDWSGELYVCDHSGRVFRLDPE